MVAQVTLFAEPQPNPFEQTADEFESAMASHIAHLNPYATQLNTVASAINALALNAEAAAGELADAVWVSGTTYAAGDVRYSPVDHLMYRRKTAGAGTTDPSLDTTNWALQTKTVPGGSDTTSSADDIALTSTSGRLQVISMTAANKKVTLPAATTLSKGVPIFVIHNSGVYRFAVRKNGGVFLCYVNPGQAIAFGCSDITTAAGIWTVNGDKVGTIYSGNTPEELNAVDSLYIAVAMLSSTKAICCYKNNSTGYLWGVILNYGSASGAPLEINNEAVMNVSIAAQTSTQATVVYQLTTATTVKGYVLDVSSDTITPGSVATIHTNGTSSGSQLGTSLTALSSTQLLCAYLSAGASTIKERVLDISGSTITPSAEAVADTTSVLQYYIYARKISATKAITCGISATQLFLRLQAVTGSTPAATGTVLTIAHETASTAPYDLVVLSSTRAVALRFIARQLAVFILDISSTTPVLISSKVITQPSGANTNSSVVATKLDANRLFATWVGGPVTKNASGLVLTLTADDRVVVGEVEDDIDTATSSPALAQLFSAAALDSTHVMQVCRNAATFLSAKTIEIA